MKIALCQINTIIGDLDYNKNKILDGYSKAKRADVDLVIFPELALVGYPPRDLVEKSEFRNAVSDRINELASQTGKTGLLETVPGPSIPQDSDLKWPKSEHRRHGLAYSPKA